ncbi:unnamed protein product [Arctogadus glacialis]
MFLVFSGILTEGVSRIYYGSFCPNNAIDVSKQPHHNTNTPSSCPKSPSSLVAVATDGDVSLRLMREGLWLRPSSSPPPRGDTHWMRASDENTDKTLPRSRSHRLILS